MTTAQTKLSTQPSIRQLAEWERPVNRTETPKRYAKKRRTERRFVRNTVPSRPVIQTLMGLIEHAYLIKAIDKWNGGES